MNRNMVKISLFGLGLFALGIFGSPSGKLAENNRSWEEQKRKLMERPQKIVGLVPVRNEEAYIGQCLRALSCYADAIVVLDDASTDNTVAQIERVAKECKVARIIKKAVWVRDEPGDRNKLLQAGREIGGTHFISLDADEMFSAPCLKSNFLRDKILALEPCDAIKMHWLRLWDGIHQCKKEPQVKYFIFCDDGVSLFESGFIHTYRVPPAFGKKGGRDLVIDARGLYGVLHFDGANFKSV